MECLSLFKSQYSVQFNEWKQERQIKMLAWIFVALGLAFFGGHLDKLVLESKCKGWLKAVFKHINI